MSERDERDAEPRRWRIAPGRELVLDHPHLLGIVNATPDSFSDGGAFPSASALLDHALRLVEEGATVLDVGGASTRPGASPVTVAEEIDRTAGLVGGIRRRSAVPISIDTTSAEVARTALDAGAEIINDVAAGLGDEAMLPLAAARGCGLILMHRLIPPEQDSYSDRYEQPPVYEDVVRDVGAFLLERAAAAEAAGVAAEAIVLDPGLGFGKTVEQNLLLIRRTADLARLGYPLLGAASRKSFLGAVTEIGVPRARGAASVAASLLQHQGGVRLFRVHDVAPHREALAVVAAVDGVA